MTPQAPDDFDYEKLARYFAGECSPAESAAILAWVEADDARRRRFEVLHQGWMAGTFTRPRGDVDAGWAAISAKMSSVAEPERAARTLRLQPRRLPPAAWRIGSRAAAILAAVGLGAVAAYELGWRKPSVDAPAAPAPEMREVATKPGQRANVYLSDGTHVILGVGSTLRFPTAFTSARDVELDGEAYFEVAHDTVRVFAVRTRYGTARDLGTKFAVRAYRDISAATITVTEGLVLLEPAVAKANAGRDSVVLDVKDVGRISADGRLSVRRAVRTNNELAWMSGQLVFDQMPVGEAVAQINRWYDVDVRLGDATLPRFTLTASLTDEPFPRAIKIIAAALDARIERRGSRVLLFSTKDGS